MAYKLEGRMIEVCTCNTVCPCFIGEAPDGGTCDVTVAWTFDSGDIEGVDVTGCTIAVVAHIPGKPLDGNWRAAVYVDDSASEDQEAAILNVFTGKLGGAIADVAKLIGEVVGVERAPIEFTSDNGNGSLKIGDVAEATMDPLVTDDGKVATLTNPLFTGSPGSPVMLGTAPSFRAIHPGVGLDVTLSDHSAAACSFNFNG